MTDKAFVVMQVGAKESPERKRADEVYRYILTPALAEFGIEPIRADLDSSPGPITAKMLSDLVGSRLVIADLTGRNPNVFYELGISHSFARPLITLADSVEGLPFDTKDERVIEIGSHAETGLSYAQGEAAKAALIESLKVVLADGYLPPSPLREVAGTQSLDALAPDNPFASEIGQIKETLDEVREAVRRPRVISRTRDDVRHDLDQLRGFIRDAVERGDVDLELLWGLRDGVTSQAQDEWVAETHKVISADRSAREARRTQRDPWASSPPPAATWAESVPKYEEPPF